MTHNPLCPVFEHIVTVARMVCPVGSYINAGALTIKEFPGVSTSFFVEVRQPVKSVNPSVKFERTTAVSTSCTLISTDLNSIEPVFLILNSVHQPVQVSKLV